MIQKNVRVALVGLGNAGLSLHLPALQGLLGTVVVGGFDPDPARCRLAAQRFKIPTFTDFDALLEESVPGVVIVCTPPDSHAGYCLRAMEGGADVICEKPFASSVKEADGVIEVATRLQRRLAVNHEFRQMPIFRALLEQVGRPDVGDVVFVQVWQLMDLPPWKEPGWRGRLLQRTLYEAGVHLVDFVLALFGEKPVAVSASTSTCGVRDVDSDAIALATFQFSGGRLAQLVQNRLCKGETHYFEVRVDTEKASLRASFGGRARLSAGLYRSRRPHLRFESGTSGIAWKEVGTRRTFLERNPKNPGMLATRDVLERTLVAFREGRDPPTSAREARDGLEVIAAAYRSSETGRTVFLDAEIEELAKLSMGATTEL